MSSSTPEIEADISKEDGNMNRLIPWKVKQGRPRSIPGCQNTDSLSILAQDVEQCPDGEYCYYYRLLAISNKLEISSVLGFGKMGL